MNTGSEVGSPKPEDDPIEDRIAAALSSLSSHIDVEPRSIDAPAASRSAGRDAEPVRTPLLWVAALALVVGIAGTWVISNTQDGVLVTGSGEDGGSPVAYIAPVDGTLDPMFLDYVAPINGDDGHFAKLLFIPGVDWARATTIRECVQAADRTEAESQWALTVQDWYAFHGPVAHIALPSLRAFAKDGVDRPSPNLVSDEVRVAVADCIKSDTSKASKWLQAVEPLQTEFAGSVESAIAEVEAGPDWDDLRRCMTAAGAPEDPPPSRIEGYIDWLEEESLRDLAEGEAARERARSADGGGSPEAKAFVQCAMPFYAEVEKRLVKPREAFIDRHHEELLRLQTEFASFA